MIAVCGIGRPTGRLNSATTAYQSARPPMVAASAKAAMKPKTGWTGNNSFATTKSAGVPPSTSVASALTRRRSAARAASAGAKEDKPEMVMAGYMVALGLQFYFSYPSSRPGIAVQGTASLALAYSGHLRLNRLKTGPDMTSTG